MDDRDDDLFSRAEKPATRAAASAAGSRKWLERYCRWPAQPQTKRRALPPTLCDERSHLLSAAGERLQVPAARAKYGARPKEHELARVA